MSLNEAIGGKSRVASLPPRRVLSTTFIPSAWADDALISERKAGLAAYLSSVVSSPEYEGSPHVKDFLSVAVPPATPLLLPDEDEDSNRSFDPEDALPSTLSRKTAMDIWKHALVLSTSDNADPNPGAEDEPKNEPEVPTEDAPSDVPPEVPDAPETKLPADAPGEGEEKAVAKIAAAYYPGSCSTLQYFLYPCLTAFRRLERRNSPTREA